VTHAYRPIGREGWDLSAEEVRDGITRGERFCLCRQCSTDQRRVYHDIT
jgi:hypothetical protein